MSKRILITTLLALVVGSNAVLAADQSTSQPATGKDAVATESVTTLYDTPAIASYEQLNP